MCTWQKTILPDSLLVIGILDELNKMVKKLIHSLHRGHLSRAAQHHRFSR